ncbi:MAG TPA: response regulator [Fimbriimonas sp.]|nr:response regulator [Fimbriimonas sp.]
MPEPATSRILIVDDEARNVQALCDTLPAYGFETYGCRSGEEALEVLREQRFDLMLTDLMMPGMDGIGLLHLARQIDPDLVAVVMTGEGTITTAVGAMKAGALDYVLKPFKVNVALPVLSRSLEVRRLRQENSELQGRERERVDELARFFTVSRDLLCIAGSDGYFKQVNSAWERALGYSEDTLLSRPFIDFVHPDDKEATVTEMSRLVSGGYECTAFENRYRHIDGSYRWIQWTTTCSGDLVYAAARDVTDQKLMEIALRQAKDAAEQASKAKGDFLSRMSHELRTPLNAILGFAQLLEMNYDTPEINEAAHSILKGGQHLLQMINEVLDLSRVESGHLAVSLEPVNLTEVLQQAFGLIQPLANAAGVGLLMVSGYEGRHVRADRQRLLQVLLNLLSNAIKYNRQNGEVRVRCIEAVPGQLRVEISDTGRGISEEDRERLFQPFQRLGDERIEGTGLGLALSERFVRLMNGVLSLTESSESGSTFAVDLEWTQTNVHELTVREGATEPGHSLAHLSGKVLYIEDNLSNMRLLEILFTNWKSLTLVPASQGQMGLEFAREHRPDLILLDLHLPDITGEEVLRRLKADEATRSIPVAMVSADADPKTIQELVDAGAVAYLTKPLDLQELFDVLEKHLHATEPLTLAS